MATTINAASAKPRAGHQRDHSADFPSAAALLESKRARMRPSSPERGSALEYPAKALSRSSSSFLSLLSICFTHGRGHLLLEDVAGAKQARAYRTFRNIEHRRDLAGVQFLHGRECEGLTQV